MKMTLFVFILLLSTYVLADDQARTFAGFDPNTDIIADNYEAGPYLIYDCVEKHWVCVMEPFYKECEEKRSKDLETQQEPRHTCAPIAVFPTKKSCFQRQLFLTTHNHGARFCIKDDWKKKAIKD